MTALLTCNMNYELCQWVLLVICYCYLYIRHDTLTIKNVLRVMMLHPVVFPVPVQGLGALVFKPGSRPKPGSLHFCHIL